MIKLLSALLLTGKLSTVLLTGGTMLISLVTYAWVFGWTYAAGFIALLFAHEMGHYLAARQRGLEVGAPCFIPFVGAWINLKEQPLNAETEAYVGIAGPIVGTLAAFACFLWGTYAQSPTLIAIAYAGFMLNLFNLIPVSPLDGGRIMAAISPRVWYVGYPLLIALYFWQPSPMLIVIAVMAAPALFNYHRHRAAMDATYYALPSNTRIGYAMQYLILTTFLALAAHELHGQLPR